MTRIVGERVSFAYSDRAPVFEGASFVIDSGFAGLIGENGAGKSTLLGLIEGRMSPSSGKLRLEPGDAVVVLVEQEPTAHEPGLSPGERKRRQIADALAREPDVLLLDEPTNHVDARTRDWLIAELLRFRGVGAIVSHDRELLDAVTRQTLRAHRGTLVGYAGSYAQARSAWEAEARAALDARRRATEHVRALNRQLHAARDAERGASASRSTRRRMKNRHDSDARSALAQTRADWAESRHGRKVTVLRRELERAEQAVGELEIEKQLGRSVFTRFERAPNPFIAVRAAGPLAAGARVLLEAPALTVRRDDRIWISGANGAGKTTLIGELVSLLRVPREHALVLPQELPPGDGARMLDSIRALGRAERGRVLSVVAALGVDPDRLLASSAPSPGEARKLAIAIGLGTLAKVVVLDEPTNHLDLPSIERLEAALAVYPGALILATHDEKLARRLARTRWELGARRVDASRMW